MRSRWWVSGLIAAVALQLLLGWVGASPEPRELVGDESIYLRQARNLAANETGAETLLRPPLYGRFLALTDAIGQGGVWATIMLQILLLAASAFLTRSAVLHLTGRDRVADLVGLSMFLYPPLAAYSHHLWPEILHLAFFTSALWILALRRYSLVWCALLGASVGLALLTKSLLVGFVPVLLAPLVLDGNRRLARLALTVTAMTAVLLPTLVTHWQRSGSPTISDSSAFNLWVGLNDRSRRNYVDPIVADEYRKYLASSESHRERISIYRQKARSLVAERGLASTLRTQLGRQYFRLFDKNSLLTDQLPGGILSTDRNGYQGEPNAAATVLRIGSFAFYTLVLIAAAIGIALHTSVRPSWLWLPLVFLTYNVGIFLLFHVKSRYRIPMMPFLFLYAALALDTAMARLGHADDPPAVWRWIAGGTGSAVLILLAFGGQIL